MTGGLLEAYLMGIAVNASYGLTKAAAISAYNWLKNNRPDLIESIEQAEQDKDKAAVSSALNKATGAIVAAAGLGSLEIDGGSMNAIKEIRFDHEHGKVLINNAAVESEMLLTGGGFNSTGETTISGNTT